MADTADREEWRERAAAVAEPGSPTAQLPRDVLMEIYQHARESYPEECCGLVLGLASGSDARMGVQRCTNVQNRRRARGESELDARRAFWIDEQELLTALREAEQRGEALQIVYHSHIDTAAYLSQTDLDAALAPDGEPVWPGVDQLVVAVYEDGVREAVLFAWDASNREYGGRRVVESDES